MKAILSSVELDSAQANMHGWTDGNALLVSQP